MKYLVATKETQGLRKNDFSFHNEGELVIGGTECDGEKVDGVCGCRRAFLGLDSKKAGTTFKVVELDLPLAKFRSMVADYFVATGWRKIYDDAVEFHEMTVEYADHVRAVAESFPVGSIIEKRGDTFATRSPKAVAK